MSRPQGAASFSAFFPAAPRAAREKAKEREKIKSRTLDAPHIRAANAQSTSSHTHTSTDNAASVLPIGENQPPTISHGDSHATLADDNESMQGDLLNGVGSASSHTSTVSSVFSAPALHANKTATEGPKNVSSLTPATNIDSSPNRITSPQQQKIDGPSRGVTTDSSNVPHIVPQAHITLAEQKLPTSRILARDPNTTVKGYKRTYDEYIYATKGVKKYGKEQEFGLVCIQSAGSIILFV